MLQEIQEYTIVKNAVLSKDLAPVGRDADMAFPISENRFWSRIKLWKLSKNGGLKEWIGSTENVELTKDRESLENSMFLQQIFAFQMKD
jgi:hypothetical protein